MSYECGFQKFSLTELPFNVHFYKTAILFLIFDVEVVFLIPALIYIFNLGLPLVSIIIIFLFFLLLGFFYEYFNGTLFWS